MSLLRVIFVTKRSFSMYARIFYVLSSLCVVPLRCMSPSYLYGWMCILCILIDGLHFHCSAECLGVWNNSFCWHLSDWSIYALKHCISQEFMMCSVMNGKYRNGECEHPNFLNSSQLRWVSTHNSIWICYLYRLLLYVLYVHYWESY